MALDIGCYGGGVFVEDSTLEIESSRLEKNELRNFASSTAAGAAIAAHLGSGVALEKCRIRGNLGEDRRASFGGGAAVGFLGDGSGWLSMIDCLITGNLWRRFSPGDVWAGAVLTSGVQASALRCTFSANRSQRMTSTGTAHGGAWTAFLGDVQVYQSIFWDNCTQSLLGHGIHIDETANFTLTCCCISTNGSPGPKLIAVDIDTETLLDKNPLFCDGIPCPTEPSVKGNFRIDVDSDCASGNSPCWSQVGFFDGVECSGGSPLTLITLLPLPREPLPFPFPVTFRLQRAASVRWALLDPRFDAVASGTMDGLEAGEHELVLSRRGPVEELPSGRYFVRLETEEQRATQAILVSGVEKEAGAGGAAEGERASRPWPCGRPVYVNADAAIGGDGSSWKRAYRDLESALARSLHIARQCPDRAIEIWIAGGTYRLDPALLSLTEPIVLLGGFGGDETCREDRDPLRHPTIVGNEGGSLPLLGARMR
jgi:hypothetical protein